jgi:teichuronic acid biosynthesis glycosyltransferase TuaG
VIVPVFNAERFLEEALAGVAAQSFRDFEIVVVDDGSTDETPHVVERWRRRFREEMRVFRQDNAGLAAARNTGVREARGRFVAFLDGDDVWLPTYLERMVGLAAGGEGSVFYCGARFIDETGADLPQTTDRVVPPAQMYEALLRANFLVPSAVVARCDALGSAEPFDVSFRRLQDWELWLRLARDGARFVGISDQLVRYRAHAASLSSDLEGGEDAVLAIMRKHFGNDSGDPAQWSKEKRRGYGGAQRYIAVNRILQRGDWTRAAAALSRAFECDPGLQCDLDLFYCLSLGQRARGHQRATADEDLAAAERHLFQWMDQVLPPRVAAPGHGTAHLALGMLAYHSGDSAGARRHVFRALRLRPELWRDRAVAASWVKSLLPATVLRGLRRLRRPAASDHPLD